MILAIAFVLFWNSGFIGAEYALPQTEPLTLLFWRYWALTLLIGLYLYLRGHLRWPGLQSASTAGFVGLLAHGVWLGCVLVALGNGVPAGIVALVVAIQPMAIGALSGPVVGEPTPPMRWVGLGIGFLGVATAVVARMDGADLDERLGYLWPFGSVVAITIASLVQRRLTVRRSIHRLPLDLDLFYQSLGTAVVVSLPALIFEGLRTEWTVDFVAVMAWLIIGVSLMAYGLMWMLIARIDATRVASLFYLGPPVTAVMGWLAFGDTLRLTDVIGLGIVTVGVLLTQFGPSGRGRPRPRRAAP